MESLTSKRKIHYSALTGRRVFQQPSTDYEPRHDFTSTLDLCKRLAGGAGCCNDTQIKQENSIIEFNKDFSEWDTNAGQDFLPKNRCGSRQAQKAPGKIACPVKSCHGTDKIIEAFEDAQVFVDNFGKIPGLAGLGLSESPHFGHPEPPKPHKKLENPRPSTIAHSHPTAQLPGQIPNIHKILNIAASKALYTGSAKKPPTAKERSYSPVAKFEKAPPEPEPNEFSPCGNPRCKSKPKPKSAGNEVATVANETGERTITAKQKSAKKKRKMNQFIHSFGLYYPQKIYGHKDCQFLRPIVPPNMGWMWNKTDQIAKLKPREGWRPGAISVFMRDLLKEAREGFFKQEKRPLSLASRAKARGGGKGGKLHKTMSFPGKPKCPDKVEEDVELPPTLHIHRKDGVYHVTMYPIRQDKDASRADEPINPLQFKIVKSQGSIASSSTASDMEIEFSPPAAVNRIRRRPDVVHVDTQVTQKEILAAGTTKAKPKSKNADSKNKKSKDGQSDKRKIAGSKSAGGK